MKNQQADGSWVPRGQLPSQKRDLKETGNVITMWNSLALNSYQPKVEDKAIRDKIDVSVQSTIGKVNAFSGAKSTEWFALRTAYAKAVEKKPQSELENWISKLRESQNKDGGFGWMMGEESDVLATSQLIFLVLDLNVASNPADESMIRRATKYVMSNQTDAGLWKVNGTKKNAKNRTTETSIYWGTTWAVIALSRFAIQLDETNVSK